MKYGARIKREEYEPREYFAERIALLIEETVLRGSEADAFQISLIELDGEGAPLAN
jgi:hypothetical protein